MIRKQRLLDYPYGRDIMGKFSSLDCNSLLTSYLGVIYQFHVQHSAAFEDEVFIQKVIATAEDLIVLVIDKGQAELLLKQDHFQCDMTFARVHGKVTEICFGVYVEEARKGN